MLGYIKCFVNLCSERHDQSLTKMGKPHGNNHTEVEANASYVLFLPYKIVKICFIELLFYEHVHTYVDVQGVYKKYRLWLNNEKCSSN